MRAHLDLDIASVFQDVGLVFEQILGGFTNVDLHGLAVVTKLYCNIMITPYFVYTKWDNPFPISAC